ncbi:MAG: SRPBCC family protein [Nocardioides sp.]
MSPAFAFTGTWTVAAPVRDVQAVLVDLERYVEWWPQVRAVAGIGPDDARVLCRSVLPYTLDLTLRAVRREERVLEVAVSGDLEGSVRWRLTPVDDGTRLDLEQEVRVIGRLLALAARLGGPVLSWNHHRMMVGCLAGLRARLVAQETQNSLPSGSNIPTA